MLTDYHTHVLPDIDDGAVNSDMSLNMLRMLEEQGVQRVVATPHFYAHREKYVESFLNKRQASFDSIKRSTSMPVLLAAEVAIEHNISEMRSIEKLAIEGTNLILLELPYRKFEEWMGEEIYNMQAEYGLKVILAHIHRYLGYYSKEQMEKLLDMNVVFQINNEVFDSFTQRSFVKNLLKRDKSVVFGSDCHNMKSRKPDWGWIKRKNKLEMLDASNEILDTYKK